MKTSSFDSRGLPSLKCILLVACLAYPGAVSAELRSFLPGEVPEVSLANAANIIESIVRKTDIGSFNPMSANLYGSADPKSGAWNFIQSNKDGRVYRFVLYFPKDLCLILDESNGQALVGSYTRDGKPVKIEDKGTDKGPDPFK